MIMYPLCFEIDAKKKISEAKEVALNPVHTLLVKRSYTRKQISVSLISNSPSVRKCAEFFKVKHNLNRIRLV